MTTLKILRNSGLTSSVRNTIDQLFENTKVDTELCRGVIAEKPEAVIDAFEMVQNAYAKRIRNHLNIQQLVFDSDTDLEAARKVTGKMVDAIGDYQVVTGLSEVKSGGFVTTVVTNPVSFRGGKNFHDNNSNYRKMLKELTDDGIRIRINDRALFDNADLSKAYLDKSE